MPGPGVAGCLTPSASANPPPFVPPAPQNLNLIRGDGTLTVTWHHARTATGYRVDYSTNGGQSWMMAVWSNNTTSTILKGMNNNTAYTVRVRGHNYRGDGAWVGLRDGHADDADHRLGQQPGRDEDCGLYCRQIGDDGP